MGGGEDGRMGEDERQMMVWRLRREEMEGSNPTIVSGVLFAVLRHLHRDNKFKKELWSLHWNPLYTNTYQVCS
jgi:hypothetical protein